MKLGILLFGLLSVVALGQVQAPAVPEPEPITVTGPVVMPGFFKFKSDMTVLKIVALSGGFQRDADKKAVRIVRRRDGAAPVTIDVDVDALLTKKQPDITLEPGDTVIVPRRRIGS